jgi:ubiquinone biosynthesis protein UbiJ
MFSFLVGLASGVTVLLNGQKVRLGLVRAVLTGGEMAKEAGKGTQRLTARIVEDFQDAVAEVKAEKSQAGSEQQSLTEIAAQLREFRAEVAAMESKTGRVQ